MAKQDDEKLDRGAMDLRGLVCLFVAVVGAIALYANDGDGTRAGIWFVLLGGGGVAMIIRAFKHDKLAGLILIAVGIVAAGLLYANDADNVWQAIILLVAGLGAGTYLMLRTPKRGI